MVRCLNTGALTLVCVLGVSSPAFCAQAGFKTLHSFTGDEGDCQPTAGVVLDKAGNLFGTTDGVLCNGTGWNGTVYELSPGGNETVLYQFDGKRGSQPNALLMDKRGNLWGTTLTGGVSNNGVILKLTATGQESVLHSFRGGAGDGCNPEGTLLAAANGSFYGTTLACGKHLWYGTVFKFESGLHRRESLLYSFKGGRDGRSPEAGLIGDAQGNLYGTTAYGGKTKLCTDGGFGGCGTIFRLAPDGMKTVLYEFKGPPDDGFIPAANLVMDAAGNLYGTTVEGGVSGCGYVTCGVVFKLAPNGTETVLHVFTDKHGDGGNPAAALTFDSAGDLYGTTEYGGNKSCGIGCGTIFEIAPDGTETILHKFSSAGDGANPTAGLVADGKGNYYGTASGGGQYGYGTVFEFTP
ncbi:MAG: choice-of-anchor tandem repeat GloVer-containing protein [Rhizomicrobium sp.]